MEYGNKKAPWPEGQGAKHSNVKVCNIPQKIQISTRLSLFRYLRLFPLVEGFYVHAGYLPAVHRLDVSILRVKRV